MSSPLRADLRHRRRNLSLILIPLILVAWVLSAPENRAQNLPPNVVWQWNGPAGPPGEQGKHIFRVNDMNQDGADDLAVFHGTSYSAALAQVRILSGATGAVLFSFTAQPSSGGRFYPPAIRMSDQNQDGVDDILIFYEESPSGVIVTQTRIYSGATGGLIRSLPQRITAQLGVGDYDGDGLGDILAGEPNSPGIGRIRIVSSVTGQTLLLVTGSTPNGGFGERVARLNDLDGDGWDEFVVMERWGGPGQNGIIWVLSGIDGHVLYSINGAPGEFFGRPVASAGDIDGDGFTDFAAQEYVGSRVRVFSGATGNLLYDVTSPLTTAPPAPPCGFFGYAIAGGDDVDGDGVPDLVVGAPSLPDDNGGNSAGRVYVLSGATGALTDVGTGLLGSPTVNCGFNIGFGRSVAMLGDVDGDGLGDMAASDPAATSSVATGYVQCIRGMQGAPDPIRAGNVNALGPGGITDVLRCDPGLTGIPTAAAATNRSLTIGLGVPFSLWMAHPPAGPAVAHYVLWGVVSSHSYFSPTTLPGGVGPIAVVPQPLSPTDSSLFTLIDTFGGPALIAPGIPALVPGSGVVTAFLGSGIPVPVTFTLQGVIQDASSPHFGMSVTNALRLQIQ